MLLSTAISPRSRIPQCFEASEIIFVLNAQVRTNITTKSTRRKNRVHRHEAAVQPARLRITLERECVHREMLNEIVVARPRFHHAVFRTG
jgi:hypothetical protein